MTQAKLQALIQGACRCLLYEASGDSTIRSMPDIITQIYKIFSRMFSPKNLKEKAHCQYTSSAPDLLHAQICTAPHCTQAVSVHKKCGPDLVERTPSRRAH